jgi:hypothetical protein
MLMDSGADTTLLPIPVVRSLLLPVTGESYQLAAFDGTVTECEAVRAVVVFLNRSFRGRFLPIESEVGVLGRNILNQLCLLLDGPAQTWEERA